MLDTSEVHCAESCQSHTLSDVWIMNCLSHKPFSLSAWCLGIKLILNVPLILNFGHNNILTHIRFSIHYQILTNVHYKHKPISIFSHIMLAWTKMHCGTSMCSSLGWNLSANVIVFSNIYTPGTSVCNDVFVVCILGQHLESGSNW